VRNFDAIEITGNCNQNNYSPFFCLAIAFFAQSDYIGIITYDEDGIFR
jgi:hypothetical protein